MKVKEPWSLGAVGVWKSVVDGRVSRNLKTFFFGMRALSHCGDELT